MPANGAEIAGPLCRYQRTAASSAVRPRRARRNPVSLNIVAGEPGRLWLQHDSTADSWLVLLAAGVTAIDVTFDVGQEVTGVILGDEVIHRFCPHDDPAGGAERIDDLAVAS